MLYKNLDIAALEAELQKEKKVYADLVAAEVSIDISRGKPCKEQLDISMPMLNIIGGVEDLPTTGADIRNYGGLEGLTGVRKMFADILGVATANVIASDNSSLNLMYDTIQRFMQFGVNGGTPWNKLDEVKWICPVPGYDRHFAITELFGIKMINVPMDENGPIMSVVEDLVASDASIKGMWCVPKYSNPAGITYSNEVVDRIAGMVCAADDFRVMWDNAYVVHDLYDTTDSLKNILTACAEKKNDNRPIIFTSTSKVTLPGSGVSCFATTEENIKDALKSMKFQTIGPNKVNQYMHLLFLKDADGVKAQMKKQAAIIRPKFETILNALEEAFAGSDIAQWEKPNGGYFISFNVLNGCAKRVGELCKGAGLVITNVGATYPYNLDDMDSNIRIAPTFTNTAELDMASKILITSTKVACMEHILASKK